MIRTQLSTVAAIVIATAPVFAGGYRIQGTWEGRDAARHLRITYSASGGFVMKHLKRPQGSARIPPPRTGKYTYNAQTRRLQLVEPRVRQNFRIDWKNSGQFTAVHLGNGKRFVWKRIGAAPVGPLVGTTWTGSERLNGQLLTFVFQAKGRATYVSGSGKTRTGKWTKTGQGVTLTFRNLVFQGTLGTVQKQRVLTGTVRNTMNGRKGSFIARKKR